MCQNQSQGAIALLFDQIDWGALATNEHDDAIALIMGFPEKYSHGIYLYDLSRNQNKRAVYALESLIAHGCGDMHNNISWSHVLQNPHLFDTPMTDMYVLK